MIPSLPNLLPTANADSYHNETTAFSSTPDQTRGRFDDLMTQALAPATGRGNSASQQDQNGTGNGTSANSTVQPQTNGTASAPENPLIQPPTTGPVHASLPVSDWRNYAAGQNVTGVAISATGFSAPPKTSKLNPPTSSASDAKTASSQADGAKAANPPELVGMAVNTADILIQNVIPATVPAALPVAGRQNSAAGQLVSGAGTAVSRLPANPGQSPAQVTGQAAASASARQNSVVGQNLNLNATGTTAEADPTAHAEPNNPAVDPDTVPSLPTAPGAQTIAVASMSPEMAAIFTGAKIITSAPVKISASKLSQNSPPVEANSSVKATKSERITSKGETAAGEQAETADSKAAGPTSITPLPLPIANGGAGDLKGAKSPVDSATSSPPSNAAISPDSGAVASPSTQSAVNGTPAAQQDVLMKSAEKTNKTTDPAGNFLPGSVVSAGSGNNLPLRADQLAANGAANLSAPGDSPTVTATAGGAVANAVPATLSAQSMERMHDLVTQHALRLSNPSDSLQVVIKPGAGTQLSLELRQGGSGVEAHAVLQQGDFNHLNERWSDLQNRLEQRGIRLAPLTDDSAAANMSNSGSQTFEQKNQPAEPRAELAFTSPATVTFAKPAARATTTSQGWETWA